VTLGSAPDLLPLVIDSVPAPVAYYASPQFRCAFANRKYAEAFGDSEASIVGRTLDEAIGAESVERVQSILDRVVNERAAASFERQMTAVDGSVSWIEGGITPHLGPDGSVVGCIVLLSDVTRFHLAERALRESEDRLAKFMQASSEGIVFHKDGIVTDANPPLLTLVGYSIDELRGRSILDFIAPDELGKVATVMAAGREITYESAILHKDGSRIDVELSVRTMIRGGQALRMAIVRDIRDRQAAERRIRHLAHHDELTNLRNRLSFNEELDRLMDTARSGGAQLALLLIDLDYFKRVNESLGHQIGDTLLRNVASRVTATLRATDLVARFGGDEFMVLLPDVAGRSEIEQVAAKLLLAIEAPVDADGRTISVTASIGIAVFPHDGISADELVKHADTAMYLAKARGRASFQFFDPAAADAAYAALVTESELAEALAHDEFVLRFQPQVRARDGTLAGAEALIRWNHPQRGLLTPDEFIPVAEKQRLMLPIGHWVLREAARCVRRWNHDTGNGAAAVPVAVNLSTVQFRAADFVESIERVLIDENVPGPWIEVELTERMVMDDLTEVRSILARLRKLGIRVSIDDFGTGWSSLSQLKDLPIDKLKIDRSFVQDLPGNRGSRAIARAIVTMAKSLDLTVIAEGVETSEQRRFLAEIGCDLLQGDAIGAALSAEQLAAQIARRP